MWYDSFRCDMAHCYEIQLIDMIHSNVTWLIYFVSCLIAVSIGTCTCMPMTQAHVCRLTHSFVTWLNDSSTCLRVLNFNRNDACVTWRIRTRRDSFACDLTHENLMWLIHMSYDSFTWDKTHSYSNPVPTCLHICAYVPCLILIWHDSLRRDVTNLYVTPVFFHTWRDSFAF